MPEVRGKWDREPARSNINGKVDFVGTALLGAAGALAGTYSAGRDTPGFTVTKVGGEAGRYRLQLVSPQGNTVSTIAFFLGAGPVTVVGAADAVYTTDKGLIPFVRNVTPASGFFDIQLSYLDDATGAWVDANPEDNVTLHFAFSAKFSSALP
jgi:hypothetical protein